MNKKLEIVNLNTAEDIVAYFSKVPPKTPVTIGDIDPYGRNDMKICGVITKEIGFSDDDSVYYTLCSKPFESNGCMRFNR